MVVDSRTAGEHLWIQHENETYNIKKIQDILFHTRGQISFILASYDGERITRT